MIGALIFSIIAVLFAWLESSGGYKHGLKLSLFTIFLFLAVRYDYGNDYMGYLQNFQYINSIFSFRMDWFVIKGNEVGWVYLNRFFGPLGFFIMTAFLAGFTSFVLYRFIKRYVPSQYYWFAVFLYVFQPGNMLILSSAMRQAVAVMFFLISIDFIIRKKVIKYLIMISFDTLFHSSSVILFPFILLGFINWKIKFNQIFVLVILFILPIYFSKELFHTINTIVSQYFPFYTAHTAELAASEVNTGSGLALNILIYLIVIYFSQSDTSKKNIVLYKIAILSLLIIPLGFVVELIGRFSFYLLPVMMAVFPLVFRRIRNNYFRLGFISITVLITIYQFFAFFQSSVWRISFGEYHTIFSAPQFY